MPNIKFNYRYSDCNNYKRYGFVIFSNPDNIGLLESEELIKSKLIYDEFFYADEWKLPEIFTDLVDFRIDPTWHVFESIEFTNEPSNTLLNLVELKRSIQ
jgi:hypothetical protein